MGKRRMSASYQALHNVIVARLRKATETLKKFGYTSQPISAKEFYDYMTGETPTGDTISIVDVLGNDFLMVHEVVEISELKKVGIPINKRTVMTCSREQMYETHYTATKFELDYALHKKNFDWLKIRMNHAKSWFEDEYMPQHLIPRYKALVQKHLDALHEEKSK